VRGLMIVTLGTALILMLCATTPAQEQANPHVGRIPWQREIPVRLGVWSGRLNPLREPDLYKCGYWHGMYQFYTGRPGRGPVYYYCPERMGRPHW
jgi:hypothetical protein